MSAGAATHSRYADGLSIMLLGVSAAARGRAQAATRCHVLTNTNANKQVHCAMPNKVAVCALNTPGGAMHIRFRVLLVGVMVMPLHTQATGDTTTRRYANSIAWQAAKARQPLPSGSILLQVSYKAGAIQSYSAMESRAGWGKTIPDLLRNGDWDYALFSADGTRRDQLNQAPCLACHKPQEANSYVFTLDALRKAASEKGPASG